MIFCAAQNGPPVTPQGQPKAEVTTQETGFTIRSRVNLVSVPVVVRDSSGHAIGGLAREDFLITDNGKPQIVSKFAVEKFGEGGTAEVPADAPAAAPAPAPAAKTAVPERYVAFFIDDLNTPAADLAQAREAAWRYLKTSIRPTERVAIATSSGFTTLDFTDDRDRLHQTLNSILPRPSVSQNSVDCPPMTVYEANLIANFNDGTALGTGVSDYLACSNSSMSASEAAFVVSNFAKMQINLADRSLRNALGAMDGLFRKMAVMAGQRTVVMVSSGFQMLDDRRQDELDVLERAIRSGIVVNSLDARGLYALVPGGEAGDHVVSTDGAVMDGFIGGLAGPGGGSSSSGAPTITTKTAYVSQEALAKRSTMAEVASATGGHFFESSNDLDAGIERLAAAPEYLYVLGFSPRELKEDGKFHTLKVSVSRAKGATIEARKGYFAPRYANDPGERSKEEIQDAFFAREETADIPLTVQTQFFKNGDYAAKLTVTARVDVRKLHFRKEDNRNRDDLTVVAGVFDSDGNYVSGVQKVLELRLLDDTLANRLGSGIAVRNTFDVTPGTYLIRLVVRDSEGETMASRNTAVEIP